VLRSESDSKVEKTSKSMGTWMELNSRSRARLTDKSSSLNPMKTLEPKLEEGIKKYLNGSIDGVHPFSAKNKIDLNSKVNIAFGKVGMLKMN